MMTSYSSKEIEKEAFKMGVAALLQKPVELNKLSDIVSEFLQVYV
jgi:DNA-binding NtrC family response regulator